MRIKSFFGLSLFVAAFLVFDGPSDGLFAAEKTVYPSSDKTAEKTPVDYVNPYMGNISHLLVPTYPTVHLPNSMLRFYPERADFTSDRVRGLPVIVTSHRGSSAFNLSPVQGKENLKPVVDYTYDQEKITPYRYSVYLDQAGVAVEYAPSHQAGVYEITFEKDGENYLVFNTRNGEMNFVEDADAGFDGITGYQDIGNNTRVYVAFETEQRQAPEKAGVEMNEGNNKARAVCFGNQKTIRLRYGVSFIGEKQAIANLRREIKDYDVGKVAAAGRDIWNRTLGKIAVEGGTENEKVVFYTSLYRTYERMVNISEDGKYFSAFDEGGKVQDDGGVPFYTDDWIWDTYRATHPLRVLIEPEMESAMIASYIRMAAANKEGWMPTFPEINGDSHRMNGNHAVAVVADAMAKGLGGFDPEAAFKASKGAIMESTLSPWMRLPAGELDAFYKEKGYFPALHPGEKETVPTIHHFENRQPVAVTLGNAYDYWCLAQIAKKLGHDADYEYFLAGSYNYRNLYNPETGFFHPKDKEGKFIEPFDYKWTGGMGLRDYYGENNGWTYRWDVPHNVADLVHLMGGPDGFANNLDRTFREPLGRSKYEYYAKVPDSTGMVGQFCMANEPSLHIPYLYNYVGQPWKTQKRIQSLLDMWFRNDLMGVPGDEDGGGTSAFVVFSALGFYPVTPGMPSYNIGSPKFSYAKLDLGDNRFFEIEAVDHAPGNKYVQSATLNGKEWNKCWFEHKDIAGGGKLVLVMGPKANRHWGVDVPPPSAGVKRN
ncbi:MAG TPA: alpha-mannosidase [Planctomycetaceae bacterium]|nr:alpha-mannosidase [Planctomycetaceae bacterium]